MFFFVNSLLALLFYSYLYRNVITLFVILSSMKEKVFTSYCVDQGEYRSVGRVSGCGSECREFEPHYPP